MRRVLFIFAVMLQLGCAPQEISADEVNADFYRSLDENFMLVLREHGGLNKKEYGMTEIGFATAKTGMNQIMSLDMAWYDLIGDMHVRFVIDGEHVMRNITEEEFSALGVSPEKAVEIAVSNIKRRYGAPEARPWQKGIMLVDGGEASLNSSYFLDNKFWNSLLASYPEGIVAGVVSRGGLIYAPVSDADAVKLMERGIHTLFESSGQMRVSSALYLFNDGGWSVYRQPAQVN